MAKKSVFGSEDWSCLALVVLLGGSAAIFRQMVIAPRAMVGLCAAANPPAFCATRAAVLWLQYEQLFGWTALVLGLGAFISGKRLAGAFSIGIGIAAVVNYNATTGIIGAALGLYAWMGLNTGRYAQN